MEIFVYYVNAFLAGIIMNIMPCSLIILILKVNRVVNNCDKDKNLFVCFGIFIVYFLLSLLVLFLKHTGSSFGWGMHMQNYWFVLFLILTMFYVTLIGLDIRSLGFSTSFKSKKEYLNNIVVGIIVGITSTTCSAPFLAAIIGFTLNKDVNPIQTILIYTLMSMGVALPFYLIEKSEKIIHVIKLLRSKSNILKVMSCMFSFAYMMWLLSILRTLSDDLNYYVTSLSIISLFAFLLIKHNKHKAYMLAYLFIFVSSFSFTLIEDTTNQKSIWISYDKKTESKPYFLYFTADWCQNCKIFEKLYLSENKLKKCEMDFVKVDLTKHSKESWSLLSKFNRNSLPTYVVYEKSKYRVLKEGPPTDADIYFKKYNCLR